MIENLLSSKSPPEQHRAVAHLHYAHYDHYDKHCSYKAEALLTEEEAQDQNRCYQLDRAQA